MYVITFYSFKGGVGRTLSLVNVAADLVRQGHRVLLIDFDLEAPGLASFEPLKPSQDSSGVVDYVHHYIATGEAPDIRGYVYNLQGFGDQGSLWVMPAGRQDEGYGQRLNSINWQNLYENHQGYLMFEDMRAQWEKFFNPDYVLIDSRTGHTDVGGICTRQLPDAVALIFTPNEQNLAGLTKVVRDIRAEKKINERDRFLHFVMANVPDIDDEDRILEQWTDRFEKELGYENLAGTIHHYDSLELLNQAIFTKTRPRSQLAREYRALTQTLTKYNPEDREGVLAFLSDVKRTPRRAAVQMGISAFELENRLDRIRARHPNDGDVLYQLGTIRQKQGRVEDALELLTQALEAGCRDSRVLLRRGELNFALGNRTAAKEDIINAFNLGEIEYFGAASALRLLGELDPHALTGVIDSEALKRLDPDDLTLLASELAWSPEALAAGEKLARKVYTDASASGYHWLAAKVLSLSLVGLGRYREALETMGSPRTDEKVGAGIAEVFNYAMAEWAETQTVPKDLFARVIQLEKKTAKPRDANFKQCLAIAFWAMGERDAASEWLRKARQDIKANPKEQFSGWCYLRVSKDDFLEDLADLETMLMSDEIVCPLLVKRKRRSQRIVSLASPRSDWSDSGDAT